MDGPFELVALVAEGGGYQVVSMDQLAGSLVTGAIRDAPTHQWNLDRDWIGTDERRPPLRLG
jgi:hypothetical protein